MSKESERLEKTIKAIDQLPVYRDMAVENDKLLTDFNCGHDTVWFETDDLKALVSELKTARAGSNYTANDDTFPSQVLFKNGRKVDIAFDGDKPYLTVTEIPGE